MAAGRLSSRQKMINLMYLVFIAMLALNIDREVLRSFNDVNASLSKTNSLTDKNNTDFMRTIKDRASKDPEYQETLVKANKVKKEAKKLVDFIKSLKLNLDSNQANNISVEGEPNYAILSDQEVVTNLLFKSDNIPTDKGKKLISAITDFNNYLQSIGKNIYKIEIGNKIIEGEKKPWLFSSFYGQPMIAAKTVLTKIQTDVKTAEGNIIRDFLTTKMIDNIEINDFKGIISSPGILKTGVSIQTFVALGAFDNSINGMATVNGKTYPLVDGKATIPVDASSPGVKQLSGSISFTDKKGVAQTRALETVTYNVVDEVIVNQAFTGVITADKMNLLYVGVDNPVTATVSGVEPSTISLSGPGLRSTGRGTGMVKPRSAGKINLVVSGRTSEGKIISKSIPFRVKGLPKPQAVVRSKSILAMPNTSLPKQLVEAKMPDDFGFDVKVTVTGFSVKVPGKAAQTVSGNRLGAASTVSYAKPGTTVTIFNIKSVASGGIALRTTANNIVIEVQ